MRYRRTTDHWDIALWNGRQLELALLDIEVPVIAGVNGPVHRHVEQPLLNDIVIAGDTATFDDRGHSPVGLAPEDGVFATTSLSLGHNRDAIACLLVVHAILQLRRRDALQLARDGLVFTHLAAPFGPCAHRPQEPGHRPRPPRRLNAAR